MRFDCTGCTRIVLLSKRYAIKFPTVLYGFSFFLRGLLANMQEAALFEDVMRDELCPVLFSLPYGLLVVMPKVRVMSDDEFVAFDYKHFVTKPEYHVPAEEKANSFGWLDGKVVVIDYGD